MRNMVVLTMVALVALVLVIAYAGPTYAAQSTVAVGNSGTAVDTVVGTGSTVPAQLVMRGYGGGGRGGHAFRSGGFRSYRAARFNHFNRFYHRPYRFYRPYGYGSIYAPYYGSYSNDCVWNGYEWVCYDDLY
jgi:hypothetical protein